MSNYLRINSSKSCLCAKLFSKGDVMEIKQLKPTEIVRDEMGFWIHPEYRKYLDKHHDNQEWISQSEWDEMKRYFNIKTVMLWMEASVSEDDWEIMMDSNDIRKWEPIAPHGFFLIDIGFSEDDAYALFAREIRKESEMA